MKNKLIIMPEDLDSYLDSLLISKFQISEEEVQVLEDYIKYRLNNGKKLIIEEKTTSLTISSEMDENNFSAVHIRMQKNKTINLTFINSQNREVTDKIAIYQGGALGHITDIMEINSKGYKLITLFKDNIVAPDLADKSNIVWLENDGVEAFKFGLEAHKVILRDNEEKMGR